MKRISILLLLMALFIGTKAQTTQWNSGVTWVPSFRTNNGATEMRFALGGIKPFYMLSDSLYKAQMAPRLLFNSLTGITRSANTVSIDTTKLATRNFVLANAGGGSSYTFNNGLTNTAGVVGLGGDAVWNFNNQVYISRIGSGGSLALDDFASGLNFFNGTATTEIFSNASGVFFKDDINGSLARYTSKYRTNLTDRSIVDKEYVDSVAAASGGVGSPVYAAKGLTKDADTIKLGGDYDGTIIVGGLGYKPSLLMDGDVLNSRTGFGILQGTNYNNNVNGRTYTVGGSYLNQSANLSDHAQAYLSVNDQNISKSNSFLLSTETPAYYLDSIFKKGIDYKGINFGNFTDSTLVPKKWVVDNFSPIGGSSYTFGNGISTVGGVTGLGGNLNANTSINLNSKDLVIANTSTFSGGVLSVGTNNSLLSFNGSTRSALISLSQNDLYLGVGLDEQALEMSILNGNYVTDRTFNRGINIRGANFANFQDSTLVPKKYVVDLLAGYTPSSQVQNSLTPASTTKAPSVDAVVTALAIKANTNGTNATGTWPISITGSAASDATKVDKTTTVNGQPLSSNVSLTKSDVGLSNVDNTSDANKPVSTAQSSAIALKENTANKQNSLTVDGSGVKFPTVDAVNSGLATKQNAITLTTTGTSGAASLIGNTLNIPNYASGGGSGTVTAVTVTTANGVSASVANQGTTPALTFTLGAITPSTVNGTGLSGTGSIVRAGNHALTFTTSAASNATVPAGSGTLVYLAGTNTFPNPQTMSGKLTVNNQTDLAGARTQIGFVGNAGSIAGQSGNQFPLVFPASLYIASANAFRYSGIMTTASASVAGSYQTNLYVNSTADNNNTGGTIAMTAAQDGKVEFPVAPTTSNGVVRLQDLQALAVTPVSVAGTSQTMAANTLYVPTSASLTTFTLPATATFGQRFQVVGDGTGGWRISQNSGQQIVGVNVATTSGTTGYIQSTNADNTLTLIAISSTRFKITSSQGTLTIN